MNIAVKVRTEKTEKLGEKSGKEIKTIMIMMVINNNNRQDYNYYYLELR
jgi:hypothetical protein